MKITTYVCDVCGQKDKTQIVAKYKTGVKSHHGEKITLDVCDTHKDFFKGLNYEQARSKFKELYGITY